ncbi:MAG: RluA family pseudouridine synthase [Paracoccaceae bacterium]|nr:MAG: RluA family pseudouridine synthase [Paracoccaceae bacterium]
MIPPSDDPDDDDAPPGDVLRLDIGLEPDGRLDKALARAAAAALPPSEAPSRSRIAKAIAEGAVSCGGVTLSDANARPEPGAVYEIILSEAAEVAARPEAIPLSVIWEDADLVVIDKPAGMVVHPAPGAWTGTLVNALLHHCGDSLSGVGGARRPGIVHRIDKDTTGLLVVAKSDRAHRGLSGQFAAHSVARAYLAVVHGLPDPGDPRLRGLRGVAAEPGGVIRISTQLDRHPTDRQRQAVVEGRGRHAVTRFRVVAAYGKPPAAALVECRLETGRTHQIRVHLAHAGHGLVGDPVYGGRRRLPVRAVGAEAAALANGFPRQALHAAELGFDHPVTGKRLDFAAPLPADMQALTRALSQG